MTCKNHVFSDSGIMIAPKPGSQADPNFRLPKQTTTVYWVGRDIWKSNSHSLEKCDKNTRKIVWIYNLSLYYFGWSGSSRCLQNKKHQKWGQGRKRIGKRIRNSIYEKKKKNFPTFFHCLVRWYPPKCLKGYSLGMLATKKRGLVLFWGTLKICEFGQNW